MLTERGVSGPSATPDLPFDEGGTFPPEDEQPSPPSTVPAEGTDAGG